METEEIQRRSSLLFPIQDIRELELDTKVHEDFIIMEKAPSRVIVKSSPDARRK